MTKLRNNSQRKPKPERAREGKMKDQWNGIERIWVNDATEAHTVARRFFGIRTEDAERIGDGISFNSIDSQFSAHRSNCSNSLVITKNGSRHFVIAWRDWDDDLRRTIRRRCEDALRKQGDDNILAEVARILKVKTN